MSQKSIRGVFSGSLLIVFGLLVGCIYDDLDNCPSPSGIYISVLTLFGESESSPVKDATVYLFDQENRYLGNMHVVESQIIENESIAIPEELDTSYWAVVWGNMGDRMSYPSPQPGETMEELILRLSEDAEGFAEPADDLYYGIKQLDATYNRVVISPITASVTITVRGLADSGQASGYYFTFDTYYGGYDFAGTPIASEMSIRMPGGANSQNELATTEPYHVVHYPDPPVAGAESITIRLWETIDGEEPLLLFSGVVIVLGELVQLQSGQTLHVLIYFVTSNEPRVSVAVTDWGQIHQWT